MEAIIHSRGRAITTGRSPTGLVWSQRGNAIDVRDSQSYDLSVRIRPDTVRVPDDLQVSGFQTHNAGAGQAGNSDTRRSVNRLVLLAMPRVVVTYRRS
jgi:hypothetical protein